MALSRKQHDVLLRPLNASRVSQRSQSGRSLSYLEAWDVKAHLIRIFGFGGFSSEVLSADLMFEEKNEKGQWHVGYKVLLRLRIESIYATYTEAAVGFSTLPQRGEAHDMAVKTAESDALKRAAINLGDQFGLSLYSNGSLRAVVGTVLNEDVYDWVPEKEAAQSLSSDENPGEGDGEKQALLDEVQAMIVEATLLDGFEARAARAESILAAADTAGVTDSVLPTGITVRKAIDTIIMGGAA